MHVGQRRPLRQPHVPPALDGAAPAAGEDDGQVEGVVRVAVPHARAVDHRRVVEQRAVAVLRRRHLLEEAPEDLHVERVDLRQLRELLGPLAVVRGRVVRVGDPDLGERAHALLAADQEARDAGQVGLERHQHQVEHEVGVLLEDGGDAGRLHHVGQLAVALALGDLDAALDVAHRVEVPGELRAVAAAELPLQVADLGADRVEDAAVAAQGPQPRLGLGGADGPEQVLEHRAGVGLHRQRGVLVAPREGGAVGAAVAVLALPGEVVGLERQLERGELGVLAQVAGRELVHRHADLEGRVRGARRLHGVRPGEERGLAARVVAVTLVQPLLGLLVGHAAEDQHPVLHRGQGGQDGRELELALRRRHPVGHAHAVGHVHRPEALDGPRRGEPRGLEGRHHPVEQRQRHARPESPQHRPAGQTSLGDEHRITPHRMLATGRPSTSVTALARFRQRAAHCLNTTSPNAPPRSGPPRTDEEARTRLRMATPEARRITAQLTPSGPAAPSSSGTAGSPRCRESATTTDGRRTPTRSGSAAPRACRGPRRRGRGHRSGASP